MNALFQDTLRIALRNNVAELEALGGWAVRLAAQSGAGRRDAYRIDLVLTEVVTNILTHGLRSDAESSIDLEARQENQTLFVTVSDCGAPFDPLSAPMPDRPQRLEDAMPGGLGLVLIRSYLDDAHYVREGDCNRLTLIFQLAPREGPRDAGASAR